MYASHYAEEADRSGDWRVPGQCLAAPPREHEIIYTCLSVGREPLDLTITHFNFLQKILLPTFGILLTPVLVCEQQKRQLRLTEIEFL